MGWVSGRPDFSGNGGNPRDDVACSDAPACRRDSPDRITLLVAGPRLSAAEPFYRLLREQQTIGVVGEVAEPSGAASFATVVHPDMVLLSTDSASHSVDVVAEFHRRLRNCKVLVLATSIVHDEAVRILMSGARGVIAAAQCHAQGLRAIRAVDAGEVWATRAVLSHIVRDASHGAGAKPAEVAGTGPQATDGWLTAGLTGRECQIVTLLQHGSSNKEIALQLQISEKTVKTHLQNIYGKFDVHRRQKIGSMLLLAGLGGV